MFDVSRPSYLITPHYSHSDWPVLRTTGDSRLRGALHGSATPIADAAVQIGRAWFLEPGKEVLAGGHYGAGRQCGKLSIHAAQGGHIPCAALIVPDFSQGMSGGDIAQSLAIFCRIGLIDGSTVSEDCLDLC